MTSVGSFITGHEQGDVGPGAVKHVFVNIFYIIFSSVRLLSDHL